MLGVRGVGSSNLPVPTIQNQFIGANRISTDTLIDVDFEGGGDLRDFLGGKFACKNREGNALAVLYFSTSRLP